jgi:peptidoglycan/LPS O-acetylase OafA/YrhL
VARRPHGIRPALELDLSRSWTNLPPVNNTQATRAALPHRRDIEGLRAVAILLVVAAHAGLPGFAGGFVGVDAFFVLSGFLISAILVREQQATGRIDFMRFYIGRFRRLAPALLLMVMVVSIVAPSLLSPVDQPGQAMAAAAAALWLSNLHFAAGDLDYFGMEASENLLLHTWSLGVEEQFYLVWPLLLALTSASGATRSSKHLAWTMAAVLLSSLALSLYLSETASRFAFYLMPTRAWQFALGGLVFLLFCRAGSHEAGHPTPKTLGSYSAIGVLGLVGLLAAAVLVDKQTAYPGVWALLPSIGTALLLAAGTAAPRSPVPALLSTRPLHFLGSVSYGWYLWHWPALIVGSALTGLHGWAAFAILGGASLVLAVLSHRLVERPLRHLDWFIRKPKLAMALFVFAMLLLAGTAMHWKRTMEQRVQDPNYVSLTGMQVSLPLPYEKGCDDWYRSDTLNPCEFGDPTSQNLALLIGDSIGLQWFPAVSAALESKRWRLVVLTKSACPMVDQSFHYPRVGRVYSECDAWRTRALEWIGENRPQLVIMGSGHRYGFSEQQWRDGTQRLLKRVLAGSPQLVILRSTPYLQVSLRACEIARSRSLRNEHRATGCSAELDDPDNDRIFLILSDLAAATPGVDVLDMNDQVCPNGICAGKVNGILSFRDRHHLNAEFVEHLAPGFAQKLQARTLHAPTR